ncbi:MAG: MFS transporter [Blastocatellia bacterium]|nr:MFS transporter [Blastocatellia bacterium]
MTQIKNLRWWIAGLLALATALNYLDRQSFPVAASQIRENIPLTDQQFSHLNSLFLLAYALMYMGGGKLMDRLGTRTGYAVMIAWWSAANFLHGMATTVMGLGIYRFLLGMGEGGGFPGSGKAVAEWFPPKERSFAFGIFNTGSSLGAVLAPPLIALIIVQLDWRWVFFITGSVGFLWAIAWFKLYQHPDKNQRITAEELEYIRREVAFLPKQQVETSIRWRDLFRYRQVWGLMAAKFLTDSAWYFFIFWLPKYLIDIRGLNIKEIGYYAWIPYAMMGAGSLLGGWLGSILIRRGFTLDHSRKIALTLSAMLMPVSLLIGASPLSLAIVFFSMAFFAHQFWSANVQTLAADLFPAGIVGSVEGLLGSAGSFGGMLFGLLVGYVVTNYGYTFIFLIAGLMHPAALLLILALVRRIEPVQAPGLTTDDPLSVVGS